MKSNRLVRQNGMIAGVAGGIAERYNIDPMLVRLFFVLTGVFSGGIPGVALYLLLWLLMPKY